MKTVLMIGACVFPLLFGGTACGHGRNDRGVIVRVKSPDERSGYLGVSIQDMTRRLAKSMDVKTDEGALVNDVTEDSPADKAGIKEEDIIVEVDGKKITDADNLREVVRKIKPETKVNIVVLRKDEKKTLAATIGKAPRSRSYSYSYTAPTIPRVPRIPRGPMNIHIFRSSGLLGMELTELNKQLGKYFEAPNGKGVLVSEVEEESKAEKAGFIAGDVITKIGKETIEDVRDLEHTLRDFKEGDKADVEIVRKGSKKTLTLEVPDMDRRHRFDFGSGSHGQWFNDFDFDVDPPDVEWEEEDHGSLNRDLRNLEQELRDLGREIQTKAKKLQQELKAKFGQKMS
jgi:membrane-associated protease RseP (regulator of RpoE activity)